MSRSFQQPLGFAAVVAFAWLISACTGRALSAVPESIANDLAEINDCGPIALQSCALMLGRETSTADILAVLPGDGKEKSLSELANAAERLGLRTSAVQWENHLFASASCPAILPVIIAGRGHYVTAAGSRGDEILVFDFPNVTWMSFRDLRYKYQWSGTALHLARDSWTSRLALSFVTERAVRLIVYIGLPLLLLTMVSCTRRITRLVGLALLIMCGCDAQEPAAISVDLSASEFHRAVSNIIDVDTQEGSLAVVNNTTMPVSIMKVTASCGCTKLGQQPIGPIPSRGRAHIPFAVTLPQYGDRTVTIDVDVVITSSGAKHSYRKEVSLHGLSLPVPRIISSPASVMIRRDASGNGSCIYEIQTLERKCDNSVRIIASCSHPKIQIGAWNVTDVSSDGATVVRRHRVTLEAMAEPESSSTEHCYLQIVSNNESVTVPPCPLLIEPWAPMKVSLSHLLFNLSRDGGTDRTFTVVVGDSCHRGRIDLDATAEWISLDPKHIDIVSGSVCIVKVSVSKSLIIDAEERRATIHVRMQDDDRPRFLRTVSVLAVDR